MDTAIARTPEEYETFKIAPADSNRMALIADPIRDKVPFTAIVEIFDVGQSFFEPPGAIHLVSANASNTDMAELIAVFVADEGA